MLDHMALILEIIHPIIGSSNPSTGILGNSGASSSHSPDEIISEAENFLNQGSDTSVISGEHLEKGSSTLYNILLSIGIFLAVAIGMYLGVKFMMSSAEDKAKYKQRLLDWLVAMCLLFFMHYIMAFAVTITEEITKAIVPMNDEYGIIIGNGFGVW